MHSSGSGDCGTATNVIVMVAEGLLTCARPDLQAFVEDCIIFKDCDVWFEIHRILVYRINYYCEITQCNESDSLLSFLFRKSKV